MWQTDEDYLREAFAAGLLIFYKNDTCIPNPGGLNKWRTGLVQVAGFGTADNEPVAFLEEGGHVALLAASREDFRVMRDVAEWPPLPEGT
jgi:hypothetical protein